MSEDLIVEKEGLSKSFRKYLRIGILVMIILISLTLIYFSYNLEVDNSYSVCGDGTPYENCSEDKPYYCEESLLVENPLDCGCPVNYSLENDSCLNGYEYTLSNVSSLKYVNRGENKFIHFMVYEGALSKVMEKPRYLKYYNGDLPSRKDFKDMKIEDDFQRELLMPLVVEIKNLAPWSRDEQARIAVSLVQNIPYKEPDPVSVFIGLENSRISRHMYQTVYEYAGSCEGKSELLAFLLKELGFEVVLFYYQDENHEAVGIKCPEKYSLNKTGYCFAETTIPGPISYSEGRYIGPYGSSTLGSYTEIIKISEGVSLGKNLDDYRDSKNLRRLVNKVDEKGYLNYFEKKKIDSLREKYGLFY